jgi:hypothetical protein
MLAPAMASQEQNVWRLQCHTYSLMPASPPRISRQLLARYDREQLYRQVWEQPMQKAGEGIWHL